jgi:hypothetical protein
MKNIGIGSISLVGLTGGASGRGETDADKHLRAQEMQQVKSKYESTEAVQQALRGGGGGVKARLDADGLASTFDVDDLDEVRTFVHRDDGTATAHIVAACDDGSRRVEFHTLPEAGRSFAMIEDGDVTRRYDDDDVSTMKDCSTDTYCSDDACSCQATTEDCTNCYYYVYTEKCCRYPDGIDCEITDSDCYDDSCCDDCYC